jgi:DNA polymerase-3 subunit beta
VDISASKARFKIGTDKDIGSVTLTTKLIDGTFPDYARVIPKANDKVLKVRNGEFVSAVDRVSTIASERGRAVKLNIGDGKLVLSVVNPEGGSATEEIAADYDAEPLEIGFNARYLLDIASQIESENVQFLLADPGSPTVVKDESDEGALYVLMPMRV